MLLSEKISVYPEFLAVLNTSQTRKSNLPPVNYADTDCVRLLNFSTAHLPGMSFVADHTVSILSPSCCRVLDRDNVSKLELLYR